MSEGSTIVVVEDDAAIAGLVDTYLRRDGHRVLTTADGTAALDAIRTHHPDLVILDVGLPGELDGLDVCRILRAEQPRLPVVFLTARDDEVDRVLGLELGADDYVTKPFSPRELAARVKNILRRSRPSADEAGATARLEHGTVVVDRARREVVAAGAPVELTTREFDLLAALLEHRGVVLTRRQILDHAWGRDWVGDERTVDVHVRQLRRKLGDSLPLTTVRGVGYRFA